MAEQILSNPAALGALKRHQLVSLSKKYGLKASGKNIDMIERLQECEPFRIQRMSSDVADAASLGEDGLYLPEPPSTPARALDDLALSDPPSPTQYSTLTNLATIAPQTEDRPSRQRSSVLLKQKRESDAWEVLSTSGASLISPMKDKLRDGSVASWKSAGNGERLNEFGEITIPRKSQSTSSRRNVLDLASSLKRSASTALMFGRSSSHSSSLSSLAHTRSATPEQQERVESIPPSPASTVGVPRRHSKITILERPSTIRLCSPVPDAMSLAESEDEDNLPFPGTPAKWQAIKERRSIGPGIMRLSAGPVGGMNRKSMPALSYSSSTRTSSVYPPIPGIAGIPPVPPLPTMPGAWGPGTATDKADSPMKFGGTGSGISKAQFSEAAEAVLREMNAKLPEGAKIVNGELLKGKKVDMGRVVSTDASLGEGGWGLSASQMGKKDRYAEAHEREFRKMKSINAGTRTTRTKATSISSTAPSYLTVPTTPGVKRKHSTEQIVAGPSAPNGGALDEAEGRAKKSKLSMGPRYLGSLRDAGRSLATLLGEGSSSSERLSPVKEKALLTPAMTRRIKEKKEKERDNGKSPSKFGFLRRKAAADSSKAIAGSSARPILNQSTSSTLRDSVRSVAMPQSDLYRRPTQTQLRRRSTELANLIKPSPELPEAGTTTQQSLQRKASWGASTILSASSKIRPRARIPDFDAPPAAVTIGGSKNSLGLPKSKSEGPTRKASHADFIRTARTAPLPPSTSIPLSLGSTVVPVTTTRAPSDTVPSITKRNSTLLQPTAASLARMQATVRPSAARPLPAIPPPAAITTAKPFGPGASRDNLFETTFNAVPDFGASTTTLGSVASATTTVSSGTGKPFPRSAHLSPKKRAGINTPGRSPLRPTSLAASRARNKPGPAGSKSRANLKVDIDTTRRRAELKARTERMGEERELRAMLGAMGGGDENVNVHAM